MMIINLPLAQVHVRIDLRIRRVISVVYTNSEGLSQLAVCCLIRAFTFTYCDFL